MKKLQKLLFAALLVTALFGCSQNNENNNNTNDSTSQTETQQQISAENILITYFTVPETDGTDTSSSASRVATDNGVVGNTEYVAQVIQNQIGGDLWQIETVQNYPETHQPLLEFAHDEMEQNERPELKSEITNLDDYDTVFIGYPVWNADLPMPLYTFLENNDLSGKTIIPFSTHGGSGFAGTISTIQQLQPNATVIEDGLTISRNDVASSDADIIEWLESLQLN